MFSTLINKIVMIKNFHWGHGIAVFYLLFVSTIIFILVASFSVDRSLVADDYYAKDLAYQGQYTKTQNALSSNNGVEVVLDAEQQTIEIAVVADSDIEGKVYFYRPSDQSQDFHIDLNSNRTTLSTSSLLKGKWILKVEWNVDSTPYYQERQIYIS